MNPRPCSAVTAVARARELLVEPTNARTGYYYGTGDFLPGSPDRPWTSRADASGLVHVGCDCAGLVVFGAEVPRHRPGYNAHNPCGIDTLDVEDDINSNSMIADALGAQDLFTIATGDPQEGDVLAYPSFKIENAHGEWLDFIGHAVVVVGVSRWDGHNFASLDIIQVKGPNGRMPAAIASTGAHFDDWRATWPLPKHTVRLLRLVA